MGDDGVGYKKPPKHSQFKKGKSGNPAGSPKPSADVMTALEKTLSAPTTIRREGKDCVVTRLEAALDRQAVKAAQGDTSAFRLLSGLILVYQPPTDRPLGSKEELAEADQKILSRILQDFAGN